ncbi:hypothetical protein Pcinc_034740 [Petrolisthes cinctipes]|uniref:Uncharacterized protein n=1 Tax=Petrolisthes cinctipes TaxID=88211 RepID=A0AAE1BZD6_PETCI|nr:hypothetical protein Pcinc_034740 [Petrolisthes cinctipes]
MVSIEPITVAALTSIPPSLHPHPPSPMTLEGMGKVEEVEEGSYMEKEDQEEREERKEEEDEEESETSEYTEGLRSQLRVRYDKTGETSAEMDAEHDVILFA